MFAKFIIRKQSIKTELIEGTADRLIGKIFPAIFNIETNKDLIFEGKVEFDGEMLLMIGKLRKPNIEKLGCETDSLSDSALVGYLESL